MSNDRYRFPRKAEKFLKYEQHTLNTACLFKHTAFVSFRLYTIHHSERTS